MKGGLPATTSPAAQTFGALVRNSASAAIPLGPYSMPAASSPRSSTTGSRPVASRISSASQERSAPSRLATTRLPPSIVSTRRSVTPVAIRMPSRRSTAASTSAKSGSSFDRTRPRLKSVTSAPKRRKIWANSHATTPPPRIASRRGNDGNATASTFVTNPASRSPGTSGILGRAPVQTATLSAVRTRPPTSTSCAETNRAGARYGSMPASRTFRSASPPRISSMTACTRAIAAAQSMPTPSTRTPKSPAERARCATSAARTIAFVGSQPALRQVPPIFQRSASATRAPFAAASKAIVLPAAPAPITSRS